MEDSLMLKKRARFWLAMSLTLSLLAFSYACGGKKDETANGGDTGGGGDTTAPAWTPKGDEGSITGKITLTGTPLAHSKIDTAQRANCSAKAPNLMSNTVVSNGGN